MTTTPVAVHLYTSAEVMAAVPGLTYRQLDYWTRTGVINAVTDLPGSGIARGYTSEQVRVVALVAALVDQLGANPKKAGDIARTLLANDTTTLGAYGRHGHRIHLAIGQDR